MYHKKRVYVAGPLTSSGFATDNLRNAVEAAVELRDAGFVPEIPHLLFFAELIVARRDEEFWLRWDFDKLRTCDAMVRLPGKSAGTEREVLVAEKHKIPVFGSVEECVAFFKDASKSGSEKDNSFVDLMDQLTEKGVQVYVMSPWYYDNRLLNKAGQRFGIQWYPMFSDQPKR